MQIATIVSWRYTSQCNTWQHYTQCSRWVPRTPQRMCDNDQIKLQLIHKGNLFITMLLIWRIRAAICGVVVNKRTLSCVHGEFLASAASTLACPNASGTRRFPRHGHLALPVDACIKRLLLKELGAVVNNSSWQKHPSKYRAILPLRS